MTRQLHRNHLARRGRTTLLVAVVVALVTAVDASAARIVYVSNGLGGSQNISALQIAPDGSLTPVSGSPFATGGTVVEGLAITPNAANVYVAAFGTGDVRGFSVGADGALSVGPGSPFATGSTPLGVAPAPDGSGLFVWNHGSTVGSWTIGSDGSLAQVAGSPFAVSPGHTNPFAGSVSPDGKHLYVPTENTVPGGGSPETLTVYTIAPGGALANIQTVPTGNNPFGSAITPDGRFVYVSNPEANVGFPNGSISAFGVNLDGTLVELSGSKFDVAPGNHPLGMAITPDGRFLYVATRITNTVNAFAIGLLGDLTPVPGSPFATGGTNGKAVALTPDGKRLYVSNQGSNNVSGFNVASDGSLTLITGSPWPTGGTSPDLESIVVTPNQAPAAAFTASTPPGGRTTFDGSTSSDTDGTVVEFDWDFGDLNGQPNGGPTVTHQYRLAGTYHAALLVVDNEGCSIRTIFTGKATLCNGSTRAQTTIDVVVPLAVTDLRIAPSSLKRSHPGNGLRITYDANFDGRVVFTAQKFLPGRRVNGRCVKQTSGNRHAPRCTRTVSVPGNFTRTAHAGDNAFRFRGRLGGVLLAAGRYRMIATPSGAAPVGVAKTNFRVV